MPMKFKIDDEGKGVMQDGLPVMVMDDGTEKPYDILAKWGESNSESAKRRHEIDRLNGELETATKELEHYREIGTPKEIRVKLEHATKKGPKDEQVKELQERNAQLEAQLETQVGRNENLEGQIKTLTTRGERQEADIFNLTVGNAFANSEFIREKTILLPEIALKYFGDYMKPESRDGQPVIIPHDAPYNAGGKPIFSRDPGKDGQYASVEEALKIILDAHPHKNRILKETGTGGSGAPGGGGAVGGVTTYTKSQWQRKMSEAQLDERKKLAGQAARGEIKVLSE